MVWGRVNREKAVKCGKMGGARANDKKGGGYPKNVN